MFDDDIKHLHGVKENMVLLQKNAIHQRSFEEVKPILRNLSDITDEEKDEFIKLCGLEPEDISCLVLSRDEFFPEPEMSYGAAHLTNIAQWAVGVKYLLSKHFDLFQLTEQGLAIDKKTLAMIYLCNPRKFG